MPLPPLPGSLPLDALQETHPEYSPLCATPSGQKVGQLDKHQDLYEGGARFEKRKDVYLRKRQVDTYSGYREARLNAAHYTALAASIIDRLAEIVTEKEPRLEGGDEYWENLNTDCDGTGRDFAAVCKSAVLGAQIHHRSYLMVDFPGGDARNLADAKRAVDGERAALDAFLCDLGATHVDDWGLDAYGELTWARVHTVEAMREGVGQAKEEKHTWSFVTPEGRTDYTAIKVINGGWKSQTATANERVPFEYGGMLPIIRLDLPVGLWVMNRLAGDQLQIFNAEAALAFLFDTNCFQFPVITSDRDLGSILSSEVHAWKLNANESASMLAPSGVPFDQLRQYIDKLEEKLYLAVDAMFLKTASKDEHGRQSGVAMQKTDSAGQPRIEAYRSTLKDAVEKAVKLIQYVRKDDAEILVTGLDRDAQDEPETDDAEVIGKIPLALQQIGLAQERAIANGDKAGAERMAGMVDALLTQLSAPRKTLTKPPMPKEKQSGKPAAKPDK